jgi:hypothetical protein
LRRLQELCGRAVDRQVNYLFLNFNTILISLLFSSISVLAVALLSTSNAYTYQTFFKVFTIVIIFALFYGTFFLPVLLSIFAPKPYEITQTTHQIKKLEEIKSKKAEESELIEKINDKNLNCDSNKNNEFGHQ